MIRRLCMLVGVWACITGVNAQVVNFEVTPQVEKLLEITDSLKQKLAATPDSLQWDLLYRLARTYREFPRKDTVAIQQGLEFSSRAERLAARLGDTSAWIKSFTPLVHFHKRSKTDKAKIKELEDQESLLRVHQGYIISKKYHQWSGKKSITIATRIWAYYDANSTLGIDEVSAPAITGIMEPLRLKDKDLNDYPGSWWIRIRLRSQVEHWEEHIFDLGEKRNFWDTVEVYIPQASGGFEKRITGKGIDEKQWDVPDRANHIRVSVPPTGDITVFIRLKGFPAGFAPSKIRIKHLNYEAFLRERVKTRHANGIFQGVVLIQFFFFLLLYLATRDHIYGNYVLYILGLCLFILNVNYFDKLDELIQSITYLLAIWLSTFGMLRFSYAYLNMKEMMPKWRRPLRVFLIIFTVITLVIAACIPFVVDGVEEDSPKMAFVVVLGLCVFLYFLMVAAAAVFLPIWGFRTLHKGYAPAKYYLIATLFLFLGFLLPVALSPFDDALHDLGFFDIISFSSVIEGGIALQLCLFALGVGHKRNLLERERREALENNLAIQQKINAATDRFVPYEFLRNLGRESIVDVHLGDQVEKHVTIFFSDIRDYTSLSEKLTPAENFLFLNNYLGRLGPIIKTNHGFVSQYYGDGIMALFMGSEAGINSAQDSVHAAVKMHKELHRYNQERVQKERVPISIGIGIHTGTLMLGVIGDEKRMDVGVVSDAVNTAARMEGLTKFYGATTIVSGSTFDGINGKDDLHYRFLGQVLVKGKQTPIKVYDFFDGDKEEIGEKKETSLSMFEEGLDAYFKRNFKDAVKIFQEITAVFPEDKASNFYLDKSRLYLEAGIPEGWTGVEIIGKL